ncbi:MAG: transcriptional repressor, partial [Bacteroidetes bacterium]|nr:transcriptional repressor [Bacteroidota bacterium]
MGEMEVKDILNKHALSATPQRIAIYQFFQNNMSHPDTDKVYHGISSQLPGISKATV